MEYAELLQKAVACHQRGELQAAEQFYCEALTCQADAPDAIHLLGVLQMQTGRLAEAVEKIERAIAVRPEAVYYGNLGTAYAQARNFDAAARAFQQATRRAPQNAVYWLNLGKALRMLDRFSEAIEALRKAGRLGPLSGEGTDQLAYCLYRSGAPEKAESLYRRLLRSEAATPEAHFNWGGFLLQQQRFAEAVEQFSQAIAADPTAVRYHVNYANALFGQGAVDEAIQHLHRQWASLAPSERSTEEAQLLAHNLAVLQARSGQSEQAIETLHTSWTHASLDALGSEAQARLMKQVRLLTDFNARLPDAVVRGLESLVYEGATGDPDIRIDAHFALARHWESEGNCERAFRAYQDANRLSHRGFDRAKAGQRFTPFHSVQPSALADVVPPVDEAGHQPRPIFIIGMPRSGTTLLEQILVSHSQVQSLGESLIADQVAALARIDSQDAEGAGEREAYPASLASLQPTDWQELRRIYQQRVADAVADESGSEGAGSRSGGIAESCTHLLDKMPQNFLHLGFLALLWPQARFIHCRRDARDTCWSCYTQRFDRHPFASDLGDLAWYYDQYRALMGHWQQDAFCASRILNVDYESVVGETEEQVRRMLDFCELPWQEDCLRFYETRRDVKTASSWQVRQPVFQRGVGRWRPFAPYLGAWGDSWGTEKEPAR